jgi:nitrate reductase assembly molybdenum cofactor insertion protein NarJ
MTTLDRPVEQLLREAAEWRLIGLLLECPGPGWSARVSGLAGEVTDPDLVEAAELAGQQASEGLYHSTFGPGGPAPPREASHRDTLQLGYLVSELEAFYAAFGYLPSSCEPPDHVAVEAGFVAYLKFKEAFAAACGDSDAAEIADQACREFLQEHVASTAEPLQSMLEASDVPYLAAVGRALGRRAGPARTRFLVLADQRVADDGDSFGCAEQEYSL